MPVSCLRRSRKLGYPASSTVLLGHGATRPRREMRWQTSPPVRASTVQGVWISSRREKKIDGWSRGQGRGIKVIWTTLFISFFYFPLNCSGRRFVEVGVNGSLEVRKMRANLQSLKRRGNVQLDVKMRANLQSLKRRGKMCNYMSK